MWPYTISIYFIFPSAIIKYPNRGEVRELGSMPIFSLLISSPSEKSCRYLALNFILYFHHNYNILSTVFPQVCLWGTRAGIRKYVENAWNMILNNWIRTSRKHGWHVPLQPERSRFGSVWLTSQATTTSDNTDDSRQGKLRDDIWSVLDGWEFLLLLPSLSFFFKF